MQLHVPENCITSESVHQICYLLIPWSEATAETLVDFDLKMIHITYWWFTEISLADASV